VYGAAFAIRLRQNSGSLFERAEANVFGVFFGEARDERRQLHSFIVAAHVELLLYSGVYSGVG